MEAWPGGRSVTRVRVSRPTDRLDDVVAFYTGPLGLVEIGRFTDHDGWDGVMLGLPGPLPAGRRHLRVRRVAGPAAAADRRPQG